MRFTTREDIELPIQAVFDAVTDFQGFERAILRRGGAIERFGEPLPSGEGQGWTVHFRHRGRNRELVNRIDRIEAPRALVSSGRIGGFEGALTLDLTALAPRQTRLKVDLDVRPRTLTARLMLQSMKLAKSSLMNRFKARVMQFARDLERNERGRG
jgi:carbon monoxide dehydrogenase subunit G